MAPFLPSRILTRSRFRHAAPTGYMIICPRDEHRPGRGAHRSSVDYTYESALVIPLLGAFGLEGPDASV